MSDNIKPPMGIPSAGEKAKQEKQEPRRLTYVDEVAPKNNSKSSSPLMAAAIACILAVLASFLIFTQLSTTMKGDISLVYSKVTALESSVEQDTTRIDNLLNSSATYLKTNDLIPLTNRISALEDRSTFDEEIAGLEDSIVSITDQIAALQNVVESQPTFVEDIAELQTNIEDLRDQIAMLSVLKGWQDSYNYLLDQVELLQTQIDDISFPEPVSFTFTEYGTRVGPCGLEVTVTTPENAVYFFEGIIVLDNPKTLAEASASMNDAFTSFYTLYPSSLLPVGKVYVPNITYHPTEGWILHSVNFTSTGPVKLKAGTTTFKIRLDSWVSHLTLTGTHEIYLTMYQTASDVGGSDTMPEY